MRAVAVLAVLLFHAELGAPGGYVGVDVFFVLSGFLVTELAVRERDAGRFSVVRFWERRARRILPALVVVTMVVLVAGWVLLLPADYAALGRSAAAVALLGANLHFWRSTDYFARAAEVLPLLHTWSLAVEEQFYVVVPLLLLLLLRLRAARRPAAAAALLGTLLLASFAWSVVAVAHAPAAAFYLLSSRAWELLLGVALALAPASLATWPASRRATRELASAVGLALVLVPVLTYRETTPFPGLAALPPSIGTALVLWSSGSAATIAGALLATRPLVLVGRISYSLYLWHWPLLAFARDDALAPLAPTTRAGLLAASFVLAVLSWRLVETPFRERRALAAPRAFGACAALALLATFAGGALIAGSDGLPARLPPEALRYLEAKGDRAFLRDVTLEDVRAGNVVRLGGEASGAAPRLLVWGDSHAMAALPAFDALLAERGESGVAVTHVATAPLLGFVLRGRSRFGLGADAPPWAEAVVAYVRERRIPDVVLVANWRGYGGAAGERADDLEAALLATVARLAQAGARPWVLLQLPWQEFDVPEALARAAARGDDLSSAWAPATRSSGSAVVAAGIADRVVAAGGRVLDPGPRFLDASGGRHVGVADGVVLYADTHHLTAQGARKTLLPLLRDTFAPGTPAATADGAAPERARETPAEPVAGERPSS